MPATKLGPFRSWMLLGFCLADVPNCGAQIRLRAYAGAGQSSFVHDVGYNSPFVDTAGTGFREYTVTVPCNNDCRSFSLTNTGLTDTQGKATSGYVSSAASVVSNHAGNVVTGSAASYAGASLEAGTVRVSAGGNFLDSFPNPNSGQDGGSGIAFAQFGDTLHFTVAGASSTTTTSIGITYTLAGVISGTSGSADVVNILQFGAGSLRSEFLAVLPTQPARVNSSIAGGWASSSFTSNTPGLLEFHGTLALTGAQTDVPTSATLTAQCGIGANCDYTHTGQFAITNLPPNVTYTSDSGVFLNVPTPAAPTIISVLNAADSSPRLSPGVLATVSGMNFALGPASNVTATVAGKPAYVSNATVNQLAIQIPVDVPAGATSLVVSVDGSASEPFAITLDSYAPALFTSTGAIRTQAGVTVTSAAPARPGDSVMVTGVGFGPTNPATGTGIAPSSASPTVAPVTLTVGGLPATVTYAGTLAGQAGVYQISFTVPAGLQGTQPVAASISGRSSNAASLPLFGISSVVSNASFGSAGTVSPGSIVSVFANGIGTEDQAAGFPGTIFQGVSVSFNGTPAPIFHLTGSQGQIDLLVPYELGTSGTANLQLKTPAATAANFPVKLAPATPSLYFLADPGVKGRTNVLAQFNNTAWLALPDSTAASLKIPGNCAASNINAASLCGEPAAAGDYLVLYTTGLGKATPKGDPNGISLKTGDTPPADGSVLYQTVAVPTVLVGGVAAQVVFSGIAPGFPGLYQIDFQVPLGVVGDDLPVLVSISGVSGDVRSIAVRSK